MIKLSRRLVILVLLLVLVLSWFTILLPTKTYAVAPADCAKLNGRSLGGESNSIAQSVTGNTVLQDLWIECFNANICYSDIDQNIICGNQVDQNIGKEPVEYAKSNYTTAIRTQATAVCNGDQAPASCVNGVVNKFTQCWDNYIASDKYNNDNNFDLAYLAGCTDSKNSARYLEALDVLSSKVDAYTGGTSTTSSTATSEKDVSKTGCAAEGPLSWIACPMIDGLATFAKFLGDRINDIMYLNPDDVFNDNFRTAWSSFRYIGIAVIIIAALVMVIGQALGLDILDAYTIRKLLPRLGIALIGISLSWPLLKLALDATNTLAFLMHDIVITPFEGLSKNIDFTVGSFVKELMTAFLGVGVAGFAVVELYSLGFAGMLSLIGSIVLALILGFFVLFIREVIMISCIVFAPIAIAAYVLPGTKKLWSFWQNATVSSFIIIIIIQFLIAMGEALARMSAAANHDTVNFTGIILYFAPYFLLPFSFKLAGGLMGTVFSIANDRSRGLFDRGRKFRQDTKKYRKGEYASQARGEGTRVGRFMQNYSTRTALAREGGLSPLGSDRRRFAEAREKLLFDDAKKRAESGMHHVGGDTDSTMIGLQARSREEFKKLYIERMMGNGSRKTYQELAHDAEEKMARLEGGFGSDIGSKSMRRASLQAMVTGDNAAWEGAANGRAGITDQMAKEEIVKKLFDDGIANTDDLAGLERANKARADNIYGSFGKHVDYYEQIKNGTMDNDRRRGANSNMYKETAASGLTTANRRAVEKIANQMKERLSVSAAGQNGAYGQYVTSDNKATNNLMGSGGVDTWVAEYAAGADIHEAQSYSGQGNAELYAKVWKEKAFDRSDLERMHPEIRREAEKLLAAAEQAGQVVTHQDVKTHLQGGIASFTDGRGNEIHAAAADANTVKMFTARKKEWGAAYQSGAYQKQSPGTGLPGS